jgi:DNA (cytosine-5)-methyltransferase 1
MRLTPIAARAVQTYSQMQHVGKDTSTSQYGIIDLFAGVGGVSSGFRITGHFDVIALVDIDKECKETYKANYPDAVYMRRDISRLHRCHLLQAANGRTIDGIVGCPPCQGFSAAGKRDPSNPLNRLVGDYFRIVKSVRPRFLVLENVPGILSQESFHTMLREIESIGYSLWSGVLNAALYGVPQTRQRAIVIGYRKDLEVVPVPPEPTHYGTRAVFDYSTKKLVDLSGPRAVNALGACPASERVRKKGQGHVPWLTYDEKALDQLRKLPSVITTAEALGDLPPPTFRDQDEHMNAHIAWGHTAALLDRLRPLPEGGDLADLGEGDRYYSQAYARLHSQGLGFTVSTHFHNPGSGRYLHYRDLRSLSVREAARLQTISDLGDMQDGFLFVKSLKASERMVGNAFPTRMAQAIANQVYASLGPK